MESKDQQIESLTRRCHEMARALRSIKATYDVTSSKNAADVWYNVGCMGGQAIRGLSWALPEPKNEEVAQ